MKKYILISLMLLGSFAYSQVTLIPDPYFEQFLIDINIDSDGVVNGQVLTSDVDSITELLVYSVYQLTDLTGLEDFVNLTNLQLIEIDITEVNLSTLTALDNLTITDVSLENLDITNNINLTYLSLSLNESTHFYFSTITSVDFSFNTQLLSFVIDGTLITELDFSNNVNLQGFSIFRMNELTTLNIKNGNNTNIVGIQINEFNTSLSCLQVDDPQSVIEGILPPYDNWNIDVNPIITDDCSLGVLDFINNQIKIFPNPVENTLYINLQNGITLESIQICDVLGKKILETNSVNQLDISTLANGLLFVNIVTDKGIVIKKVIKQ